MIGEKSASRVINRIFFPEGQEIFTQGEPSHNAYFVQQGAVLLSKRTANGIVPYSTVREKQIFGEMALLEEEYRDMTATAIVDTTCIMIREDEFNRKVLLADPMVKAMLRVLARNLSMIEYEPSWEDFKRRERLDGSD